MYYPKILKGQLVAELLLIQINMDWDKLKIFHTVAEAGSFTKASTVLNLSQSAISRQIQTLENELKNYLFERHARGLVLKQW